MKRLDQARIAIIHYWIVGEAGGEKVLRELSTLYPQADIFTLVCDQASIDAIVPGRKVIASFLNRLPGVRHYYRKLLPLMPMALESLNLDGYDLILSSESGPAKGIVAPLGALHICYCHSPMRYLWDQAHDYAAQSGRLTRMMMTVFGPRLRLWDFSGAQRIDAIVANSTHVKRRIRDYWRRDATVIHPPVDIDSFAPDGSPQDFYLITGRHVGYKRIDLAIAAANRTKRRLIIAGSGPDTPALARQAGETVQFVGRVSQTELARLYAACRTFLMPGEEDFGIAPIEAMASGRPVIAYGRGGALDSVVPGTSGELFDAQTVESLIAAMDRFEAAKPLDPASIRAHAEQFSTAVFRQKIQGFIETIWAEHQAAGRAPRPVCLFATAYPEPSSHKDE